MSKALKAFYELESPDIKKAADALAVGQSVGNPDIRTHRDTPTLMEKHCATVESIEGRKVVVNFPAINFGPKDGIAHLMSVVLGGQTDIDLVQSCKLIDIDFGSLLDRFPGPRFGLDKIRKITGAINRPLIGGIVKPKIGLSPEGLAQVCYEMAKGGVDFIKEDEILGDPPWCPLKERVPMVAEALKEFKTIYAPCITADGDDVVRKAELAKSLGAGAVHINLWSGLGAYWNVRNEVDIPVFFQKSGDKVWTTGPHSLKFSLLCKIIRLIGCDFTHVGMWGGYMSESEDDIKDRLNALQGNWCLYPKVIPSFSCGAHPGMVQALIRRFGNNIMISSGGAIHGHPMGTEAGARAFRQAIDQKLNPGGTPIDKNQNLPELAAAIATWGMVQ